MPATLSDTLPKEPFDTLSKWMVQAANGPLVNPNAMTLASVDARGKPAARIVLCKHIEPEQGYLVFYTNYESDKGTQLTQTPQAAAVFYWDSLGRQVRVRGPVHKAPAQESDAYFGSRHRGSRLGAWASAQSRPIDSRAELIEQLEQVQSRFPDDTPVPRPPHWGGFRLWAEEVELWSDGEHRIHDRARWVRTLTPAGPAEQTQYTGGAWHATRLQP